MVVTGQEYAPQVDETSTNLAKTDNDVRIEEL